MVEKVLYGRKEEKGGGAVPRLKERKVAEFPLGSSSVSKGEKKTRNRQEGGKAYRNRLGKKKLPHKEATP